MKKALLLPCLLLVVACGGTEAPETSLTDTSAPPSPLITQEADIEQPAFWYTCNLPCRTGYCATSVVNYPGCIPYGSSVRYTCTPCTGGGQEP